MSSCALVKHRGRNGLADWVSSHQLAVFFGAAFLFSWTIDALVSGVGVGNSTTHSRILLIGAYGPSLAAMLLSGVTAHEPRRKTTIRLVMLLPVLLLVIGSEWLDHIFWGHDIDASLILADVMLIGLAVWVIVWLLSGGAEGRRELLGGNGRGTWGWVLVALGLWPAMIAASNAIGRGLGKALPFNPAWQSVPVPFVLPEAFLWALLFGGALNEEPGWRGFALPRLQARFSPVVASIILGGLWGLWHVPLHLMGAYGGDALGAAIRIMEIPRAILFTWLYNRTRGSLLVVLLLHAATNTAYYFVPRYWPATVVLCSLLAATVVVTNRMWRRLPLRGDADAPCWAQVGAPEDGQPIDREISE